MARPSKPRLSAEAIATTALEMAGETGGFTVPELAKRLNVRQSSLYNHVSGRAEIVELIRRQLREAMAVRVEVDAYWPDAVRQVASAHRSSMARHPWLLQLLATSPAPPGASPTAVESVPTVENLATVLSRAGFTDQDVLMTVSMIDIVTIGASLEPVSPEDLRPAEALAGHTTLARVAHSVPPDVSRADAAFEFTVELVIEALHARLRRSGTAGGPGVQDAGGPPPGSQDPDGGR